MANTIAGEFSLWNIHSWDEIEEELAEVSGTARAQYDDMRRKVPFLTQQPDAHFTGQEPCQVMPVVGWQQGYQDFIPGYFDLALNWHQAYQNHIPLQQGYYETPLLWSPYQDSFQQQNSNPLYISQAQWSQIGEFQQKLGHYQGQIMPNSYFQQENTPPLVLMNTHSTATPLELPNKQMFTFEFVHGDLTEFENSMLVKVSGDSKLSDVFDGFFSRIADNILAEKWQIPRDYYFMQVFLVYDIVNYGKPQYYHGAKMTGRMIQDVEWYHAEKIVLVGSGSTQPFFGIKSPERADLELSGSS